LGKDERVTNDIRNWVIQQLEDKIQTAQGAGDDLVAKAAQTELDDARGHQQVEGRTVLASESANTPRCSKDHEEWPCPRLRNIAAQFDDQPGWDPSWEPVIAGG
jgi:hypothetical protein